MKSNTIKRTIFDSLTFAYLLTIVWYYVFSPSEAELLDLGPNAIKFALAMILGVGVSLGLNAKGMKTWGEIIFEPPHKKATAIHKPMLKTLWGWHFIITFFTTFFLSFVITDANLAELLDEGGFAGAIRLFQGLASPNWAILPLAVVNIVETIFMAFLATILAIPIAFVLSFLAAKNIMKNPVAFAVYLFLRTALNLTRSIEALIWAIIFSVWVGIGPFAGMLALMIHSIASLAKQYSEMVESVSEGPIEGVMSTGANPLQVIWFAIVPQVILPYISFTVYRWDINVRMATIIGLVGGGGIGTLLIRYQGQAMWAEVGTIILVIAFVVWAMDQASAYIREALK